MLRNFMLLIFSATLHPPSLQIKQNNLIDLPSVFWLSGKLTQEFHASYQVTIEATRSALKWLNLQVVKETDEEEITRIKGVYSDGREMWIDIHRVTDYSTNVEVWMGSADPEKKSAGIVLKKIQSYL